MDFENDSLNYKRIEKAITYLVENQQEQPSLSKLSSELALSEFHLQRTFTEWAGISPKQFLQYLNKEQAKKLLPKHTVLSSSLESGLSGTGRLHDLMVTTEGVTPGEYKAKGKGLIINFGFGVTPYGDCMLAWTARGICKLGFYSSDQEQLRLVEELKEDWSGAELYQRQKEIEEQIEQIFSRKPKGTSLKLLLRGTPFRLLVWEALLKIPEGDLISYQALAASIDKPSASRAVASAVASNPIGWIIPCHRVIRQSGAISGYRWGEKRKQAMIIKEQCL